MLREAPILAVDLGTGTCLACVIQNDVAVHILPDPKRSRSDLMDSIYLAKPDGRGGHEDLVGHAAQLAANSDPYLAGQLVRNVKRMLRDHPDKHPSSCGRVVSPVYVSTKFLEKLKEAAEVQLGLSGGPAITRAVVAVPSDFTLAELQATREAGLAAGFHEVHLIDEPLAVVYALPRREQPGSELSLIADLGQGTFDLLVARIGRDAGEFGIEELGRGGDADLGGMDWTRRIAAWCAWNTTPVEPPSRSGANYERFQAEYARLGTNQKDQVLSLVNGPGHGHSDLWKAAEAAKRNFYAGAAARVFPGKRTIEYCPIHDYPPSSVVMTSEVLRKVTAPLEERCVFAVERLLGELDIAPEKLERIHFAGGGAHVWTVREAVQNRFRVETEFVAGPQHAVVKGAAIHALLIQQGKLRSGDALIGRPRAAHTYGVRMGSGGNGSSFEDELVRRHAPLPAQVVKKYTVRSGARSQTMELQFVEQVYQGIPSGEGEKPRARPVWKDHLLKSIVFPPRSGNPPRYRLQVIRDAAEAARFSATDAGPLVVADVRGPLRLRILGPDGAAPRDYAESHLGHRTDHVESLKRRIARLPSDGSIPDDQELSLLRQISVMLDAEPGFDGKETVELAVRIEPDSEPEIKAFFRGKVVDFKLD